MNNFQLGTDTRLARLKNARHLREPEGVRLVVVRDLGACALGCRDHRILVGRVVPGRKLLERRRGHHHVGNLAPQKNKAHRAAYLTELVRAELRVVCVALEGDEHRPVSVEQRTQPLFYFKEPLVPVSPGADRFKERHAVLAEAAHTGGPHALVNAKKIHLTL